MAKPHWTQTAEGKARMADVQRKAWATKRAKLKDMAKKVVAKAKRGTYKPRKEKASKPFVVRTHGYRIILDKNEIRIENE